MKAYIHTSDYDDDGGYFTEVILRDEGARRSLGAGASSWSQERALTRATASATEGIARRMKAGELTEAEAVAQAQAVARAVQAERARLDAQAAQFAQWQADEAQVRG